MILYTKTLEKEFYQMKPILIIMLEPGHQGIIKFIDIFKILLKYYLIF